MELTLEIPSSLDAELDEEAKREGISPVEQATLLLHLANALSSNDDATPFKKAVKGFLSSRSLDPGHVAYTLEQLIQICALHDVGKRHQAFQDIVKSGSEPSNTPQEEQANTKILMDWRNESVHLPANKTRQRPGRAKRSCLGKYSHLPGSDADFAREKVREIAHEERGKE